MKVFLFLVLTSVSFSSFADVIHCVFTEPFISTTYSTPKSRLTYQGIDKKQKIIEKVSFQIKAGNVFELVSREGKVLQSLTLNHKGSDGMSDHIYPYDVKDNDELTQNGRGGCRSNFLKVQKN